MELTDRSGQTPGLNDHTPAELPRRLCFSYFAMKCAEKQQVSRVDRMSGRLSGEKIQLVAACPRLPGAVDIS